MKMRVETRFDVEPERVWAAFDCEEFHRRMTLESGLDRTVLEKREENGVFIIKTRVVRNKDLPKIAAKVLGTRRLTYLQTNSFDPANNKLRWDVDIPSLGERLKVSGTTTVTPTATGCTRVLDGDVTVKVRLIGAAVEKAVGGEFQKSVARAAEIVKEILSQG